MLDKTLIAWNPVFQTSCPLAAKELKNSNFTNNYIKSLKMISQTLKARFKQLETNDRLNKDQWLCSASQLMASIHKGVYRTFPLLNAKEYKAAFGMDKTDAACDFGFAVGSLHYFFTNMVVNLPH